MGVIGHWRRSALGAGGVALLLPLGLAIGVALTAAMGGSTRLRALGQVFAGPTVPSRAEPTGLASVHDVPSVPVLRRPATRRPSAAAAPASGSAPSAGGNAARPAPSTGAAGEPTAPSGGGGQGSPEPSGGTPSGGSGSGGGSTGGAPPSGSPVKQTGQAVADAAAGLPAPAGQIAADAMQTVVDLIP